MMRVLRGSFRLALLIAALLAATVAAPAVSGADDHIPQCSDGVDNDGDGAIDGADAGCGPGIDDDESDSIYAGIKFVTIALPLVSLQGSVNKAGVVNVSRLIIRAQRGSTVNVTCKGKHCPVRKLRRTMLTTTIELARFEGKLRPSLTLVLRIGRPGQLSKYVRYKVREGISPVRFDACLDGPSGTFTGCFSS